MEHGMSKSKKVAVLAVIQKKICQEFEGQKLFLMISWSKVMISEMLQSIGKYSGKKNFVMLKRKKS